MTGVRRSGRIPREIPILLLGTNTSGRVFSEETRTLVLSRHGAGILSRNKLAPDEVLTLRTLDTGREAEIRLVGNLGEGPGGANVYGVAFCDPALDFWQMEFPPPEPLLPAGVTNLECSFCGSRTAVEQSEVEADVFLVSQSVFRYCDSCGQTTPWKLAAGDPPPPKPKISSTPPIPEPSAGAPLSVFEGGSSSAVLAPVPAFVPAHASAAPVERSAYSGSNLNDFVSGSFFPEQPVVSAAGSPAATAIQTPPSRSKSVPPPAFSGGGKPNRRRHVRTRVRFTACVRLNHSNEEIVECDNVSKGGLCFRSRKQYAEGAAIEVAVPYSPGQPAIFVPAQIRRVEELPALGLFRYGVAYS